MNWLRRFYQRLTCKHDYEYIKTNARSFKEADFSGDGYNCWTDVYDIYVCRKCGKKKELYRYTK